MVRRCSPGRGCSNTSSSCNGRLVDRRSDAGVPPIDGIGGAGNEARFVRDKEAYCRGDLLGLSEAVHRMHRGKRRLEAGIRSEEHTSELQSLMRISYAVFCLKKKKKDKDKENTKQITENDRRAKE